MTWIKKLNPFYWRAEAQKWEQDYHKACEGMQHLSEEVYTLKKQVDVLAIQYDYPTHDDLCSGVKRKGGEFGNWINSTEGKFTPTEQKLLIDLKMLQQHVDYLEEVVDLCKGNTVADMRDKLSEAEIELEDLQEKIWGSDERIAYLEKELEAVSDKLEKAQYKLKTWFNFLFGYGLLDNTLLTKSFWGKNLELIEFPEELREGK